MRSVSRRRHMARSRRPMVSTLGLTRSKGSVSHAGKTSTWSAPRKAHRSWATRSASVDVGTATTSGCRPLRWARPATVMARAGSGTATTAVLEPASSARAGSARKSGGSDVSSTCPPYPAGGLIGPRVEPVHGRLRAVLEDRPDRIGGYFDGHVQGFLVGLPRTTEDVVGALALARRFVDADAHPHEPVVVQVGLDRLQAVVAGGAAADFELHPADGKIVFIVDDDQVS